MGLSIGSGVADELLERLRKGSLSFGSLPLSVDIVRVVKPAFVRVR